MHVLIGNDRIVATRTGNDPHEPRRRYLRIRIKKSNPRNQNDRTCPQWPQVDNAFEVLCYRASPPRGL